jgi:hypothetical protein
MLQAKYFIARPYAEASKLFMSEPQAAQWL